MSSTGHLTARPGAPTFAQLFTPKLVTILREGYSLAQLRADLTAGMTVAVVALPLSMAIAIASGVTPERGLYAAIFGGFVVSALGGSRFQIGGPAGAFIVLVAATVAQHGLDGLILATFMSGLILLFLGWMRLGTFIKYIPYPVTVGFTAGIALIILVSQFRDFLGLTLPGREPAALLPKLQALAGALPTLRPAALVVAGITVLGILLIRHLRPHAPAYLIAVAAAALLAWAAKMPIETIGSRFGGIAQSFPLPHLPNVSLAKIADVAPSAASFALLGAIESLLSAVVADSMSGRRHRSNCELVAQGAANVASALFGGICVTGTIARTATNVRAGAHGPVSGMLHAVFLLLFLLVAAPLASFVPLAALAGVLVVVAWGMAEKHEFLVLLRASRGEAVVLFTTFSLVAFRDLSEGIVVGFALSALLFLHRIARTVEVQQVLSSVETDEADTAPGKVRSRYEIAPAADPRVVVYRISGAFFFGAAAAVAAALEEIGEAPTAYIIDFSAVSVFDSTGAATIAGFVRKARRKGTAIIVSGANPAVKAILVAHRVHAPEVAFATDPAHGRVLLHRGAQQGARLKDRATALVATSRPVDAENCGSSCR